MAMNNGQGKECFEVIHPGALTTIQDLGRFGYQQYGVPTSGAMDNYAFRLGNLLLGNEEGAAGLEITLSGLQLRVLCDTSIAITGANQNVVMNNKPLQMWEAVKVKHGDIISFRNLISGCRSYLAMAGGITVPRVMKSSSTYIKARIGGMEGRALRIGDRLRRKQLKLTFVGKKIPSEFIPVYRKQIDLRVIPGPQDEHFTSKGIQTFYSNEYTVSLNADRMGYVMNGTVIEHKGGADIVSDGIPLGAIQVPGNGLPIILLADRQTTGGYAKIAVAITADIPMLAQLKPGDIVRFVKVTQKEAFTAYQQYEQKIGVLKLKIIP